MNHLIEFLFGTGSFTGASTGDLTVTTAGVTAGSLIIDDAGTIGSATDTDAIAISSGGVVSISATIYGKYKCH